MTTLRSREIQRVNVWWTWKGGGSRGRGEWWPIKYPSWGRGALELCTFFLAETSGSFFGQLGLPFGRCLATCKFHLSFLSLSCGFVCNFNTQENWFKKHENNSCCVTFPAVLRVFSSIGKSESKEPTNLWGKIYQRSTPSGYLKPSKNRAWVGFHETTDSFLG